VLPPVLLAATIRIPHCVNKLLNLIVLVVSVVHLVLAQTFKYCKLLPGTRCIAGSDQGLARR